MAAPATWHPAAAALRSPSGTMPTRIGKGERSGSPILLGFEQSSINHRFERCSGRIILAFFAREKVSSLF
jgi:hypothetical protein